MQGDEELSSSCFATPLSSPLPSRPASHVFQFESEFELTSSAPSESGYNGSADDGRSTSSEQMDCKELQQCCDADSSSNSDNDDDGSKEENSRIETISSLPLSFLNSSNDSGISVSESTVDTPLDTPGADSRCAPVFPEMSNSLTASSMEVGLPLLSPTPLGDCTVHQMTVETSLSQSVHGMSWSDTNEVQEEQQTDEEDADLESDDSMHNVVSHTPLQYEW